MNISRTNLKTLSTVLLLFGMAQRSFGQPVWSLSLEPNPLFWTKGGANVLTVKLKNMTARPTWIFRSNPLHNFSVNVSDSKGVHVSMTARGAQIVEAQNTIELATGRLTVAAGAAYENEINLGDLYDLRPGKYITTISLATFAEDNFDTQRNRPIARKQTDIPTATMIIEVTP